MFFSEKKILFFEDLSGLLSVVDYKPFKIRLF